MPSSLLIVVLVVVWLFVLAPMAIRTRKPIRRAGDGLAQTRTVYAGGSRRLQPNRARMSAVDDAEPVEVELFGLPSGAGSTDAELVDADSWLERLAEDRKRHLGDARGGRQQATQAVRRGAAERPAGTETDVESRWAGIAALAQPRVEVAASFRDSGDVGGAEDDTAAHALGETSREEMREESRQPAPQREAAAAGAAERTYVVDGEVFERPESAPEPSARERREAEQAARAAARAAERPQAPELDEADYDFVERRRGRGVYDPRADRRAAAARAVRRQRTALGLIASVLVFALLAVLLTPHLWWGAGLAAGLLVAYLAYLRKQVRMEQALMARRMERLRRARLGVESRDDAELAVVPQRLRRPGAVVLEADDEDPVFDHLDSPQTVAAETARREARPAGKRGARDNRHGPTRRAV